MKKTAIHLSSTISNISQRGAIITVYIYSFERLSGKTGIRKAESMYRRRGSAPAAVLQQTLQQFQESKGHKTWFENNGKHLFPTEMLKHKKTKLKTGGKDNVLEKLGNGSALHAEHNEKNFLSDSESISSLPLAIVEDATLPKGEKNGKATKVRYNRRGSVPATIAKEYCIPFYAQVPTKNFASLQKKSGSCKDFHIVLLGQRGVGKSALLVRFITGRFIHEYDPALEMTYEVCEQIDEDTFTLQITDTASTHKPVYLNQNEGFIVVYAVDDFRTFEIAKQLVKLVREIKKQKGQCYSIAFVGNKMDLRHNRVVSKRRARGFALEHECLFYEVSAAKDLNVKLVFHDVIRQLRLLQLTRKSTHHGPMGSIKKIFNKI